MQQQKNSEKDVNKWTRKEFESLPHRKWNENIGTFSSMVILPLRKLHDSGYRLMDFVAVKNGIPFIRLSGCSDVINFDGIGGYGKYVLNKGLPRNPPRSGWSIDCLKVSGLMHIWCDGEIECDSALSSFSIYSKLKP